jgi:2-C-methyl-D-erythritol 4-phosphate cytidylyltransferase
VAAGTSARFSAVSSEKTLKQFIKIKGKRVIDYSIEIFSKIAEEIILVLPKGYNDVVWQDFLTAEGGPTRRDSVYNGLLKATSEIVLIHDAARPFITRKVIENVVEGVKKYGAALPVVPVRETLKISISGFVDKTIDRSKAFLAQTPQGFDRELILKCFKKTLHISGFTDDASVAEACGVKVFCAEGDVNNIKITVPDDLRNSLITVT